MTEWEPATEAEAAMQEALRANDQQLYFRILSRTDLLLPVSAQALAGQAPMNWGTWTTGGRTHVLAFTSPAAMRACLGEHAGASRRAAYGELADHWPNHEWWLAVNPGLPIEGYLPAWYVAQLSRGDVRLPGRTMGARARLERAETLTRGRPTGTGPAGGDGQPSTGPQGRVPQAGPGPEGGTPPRPAPPPVPPPGAPLRSPAELRAAALRRPLMDPGRTSPPGDAPADRWPPPPGPDRPGRLPADAGTPTNGHPTGDPDRSNHRSFFEPASGRANREERAVPPPRFGRGGQPFPRRRPLTDPLAEAPTQAFPAGDETRSGQDVAARAFATPAEETSRAPHQRATGEDRTIRFPVPDPATLRAYARRTPDAEATQALPRRRPAPAPADPEPASVAEPVSGPPAPRRGFTPIVIEGTIVESRDLSVPPVSGRPGDTGDASRPTGNQPGQGLAAGPVAPPAVAEPGTPPPAVERPVPAPAAGPVAPPPAGPVTPPPVGGPVSPPPAAGPGQPARSVPELAGAVPDPAATGAGPVGAEPVGAAAGTAAPVQVDPPAGTGAAGVTAAASTGTADLTAAAAGRGTADLTAAAADTDTVDLTAAAAGRGTADLTAVAADTDTVDLTGASTAAGSVAAAAADPTAAAPTAVVDPARTTPGAVAPTVAVPPDFEPANEVEEDLLDATGSGSTDTFLSTLLLARVLLPVDPDSAAGSRPGEPGFVWRTEELDGETFVVVYTSPERLADHTDAALETVRIRFVQLIHQWPERSWSFAVNPGSPIGAKLPGEQIVGLANWAAEVGLRDDGGPEPEPSPAAEAPADRPRYEPPAPDPTRPVVMQKAVAPGQLAYYLERGYDRVSGFVHRAGELAHLTTPAQLYDALGLNYPDSPFHRAAEEIHVLRWPAHRPSLYRIPYGGQTEPAMRAMEGWVIERPPFRGNGFAPGEGSDVVAEFKVDSARLPHGAQLWRIGADGTERVVATLDADVPVWRQAGDE